MAKRKFNKPTHGLQTRATNMSSTHSVSLPFRQIHLDFHTGPNIPDVGQDFDAREFARIMKRAHVNSVTVFAKCHHGHLYYNTKRPERHPGLSPNLDLLGEQVESLHREGIRAPIYLSVQCDEYAANTHPEWVAREPSSAQVKGVPDKTDKVFGAGWQILDMSTPYQDFLAEQTVEVLDRFKPVDGIFFDMCWDQPSTTREFIAGMRKTNLNPELEADRYTFANSLALGYMERFHDMVKASNRHASVYFNGRGYQNLGKELPFQAQIEIEALPTGGWGYLYFPLNVRYAQTFDAQYMGMTARFHKSWADFGGLKPYPALEYETSQMIASGARCSIGDQLPPRGVLDAGAYELIAPIYKRIADREPWLQGAHPLTQIGLIAPKTKEPPIPGQVIDTASAAEGAVRMFTQLKHQFEMADPATDFSKYDLLVLADGVRVDGALATKLGKFVKAGGALLASGLSGLSPDGQKLLLPELNIKPTGASPFTATYIRFTKAFGRNVPDSDHVMYDRGIRCIPGKGASAIAQILEPYFERTWDHFSSHFQTPPTSRPSPYAAATLSRRVAFISYPIFGAYARHGNFPYRLLIRNILEALLPEPLLRVDAPSSTEATMLRQPATSEHAVRTIVHLLQYCPERRTPTLDLIEDIVPIFDVPLSLKLPGKVQRAYLAPEGTEIPFEQQDARVKLRVPKIHGHTMVVFE